MPTSFLSPLDESVEFDIEKAATMMSGPAALVTDIHSQSRLISSQAILQRENGPV